MTNYCKSCGVEIPDEQEFCSMCYGDPYYGTDGYYLEYLEQLRRQHEEDRYREQE